MNTASSDTTQQQQTTSNGQHHPEAPSERVDLLDYPNGGRILCVADIRGKISRLNELASIHKATAIIHTGDFGFYDKDSVERISDRTLRHVVQYSSLIDPQVREKHFPSSAQQQLSLGQMREKLLDPTDEQIADQKGVAFIISEFPKLVSGEIKLNVPVYAVYGACEDIAIIEKIRLAKQSTITTPQSSSANASSQSISSSQEYSIHNLTVLSEGVTRCIVTGGVRLRLFGLGGSLVHHKLFDNGEGAATIAGGNGVMWTTALQIGELIDTAQKVFDPSEVRVLITHGSIGKEGLLAQLALAIKADYTISGALHFRYGSSYNDFATQTDPDTFRAKFTQANKGFMEVYETVKTQIDQVIDDQQKKLLQNALAVARRIPNENAEEPAWKNSWHWNLPDAAYGSLVLDIKEGRVGSEMKNTGFNFAYRMKGNAQPLQSGHQGNQQQRNNRAPFPQKPIHSPVPQQQQQQSPSASTSQAQAPAMSANPSSTASSAQGAKPVNTTGAPSASTQSGAPPTASPTTKAPPSSDAFNDFASGFARKPVFNNNNGVGSKGGFGGARNKGPGINHPREQYVQQGPRDTRQQHQPSTSSASASSPVEKKEGEQNGSDPSAPPATTSKPADPLPTPSSTSTDWRTKPNGDGAKEGDAPQQPRRTFGNNNYNNNRREGSGNWSNGQGDASSGGEGGAGRGGGQQFRGGRGRGNGFQNRNQNPSGSPGEGGHQNSSRGGPNNRGPSNRGDRGGRGGHRGGRGGGFSSGDGAAASGGQGQGSAKAAAPASSAPAAPSPAPAAAPTAST